MDLFFFVDTGDLDPGDDLHLEILRSFKGFVDPGNGVMICESHGGEAEAVRTVYHLSGS